MRRIANWSRWLPVVVMCYYFAMALTMTPTQFNRESSRVLRTVRGGSDVVVPYADGTTVLVTTIGKTGDVLADAVRSGRVKPAKSGGPRAFAVYQLSAGEAQELMGWFEDSRNDEF